MAFPAKEGENRRPDGFPAENPYFHFDPATKNIEDRVFRCRAIMVNEQLWNMIKNLFLELVKDSGPLVLYELGMDFGYNVAVQSRGKANGAEEAIKFLEYYGLLAGWGRFEASEFSSSGGRRDGRAVVKVHNGFFAQAVKNAGSPGCFFVSGLLAGVAEGLFGEGHNCMETKCMAAGDSHCEFVLTRRPGQGNT